MSAMSPPRGVSTEGSPPCRPSRWHHPSFLPRQDVPGCRRRRSRNRGAARRSSHGTPAPRHRGAHHRRDAGGDGGRRPHCPRADPRPTSTGSPPSTAGAPTCARSTTSTATPERSPAPSTGSGAGSSPRAAARHPDRHQGEHRHRRPDARPRPARWRCSTPAGRIATVPPGSVRPGRSILGKANLVEWANFRCSSSSSGWSARGGAAANPYVLDRNPCGSSSGSARQSAANLAAASLGTETDGSIVCPASANGWWASSPPSG